MKPTITIDAAMRDKNLLGAALGDINSWSTWMVGIKAAFGLGLITDRERETFEQIAGGRAPPTHRVRELWCFVGRRGGKSRVAALPTEVTMIFSGNAEARHIRLNASHSADPKPSWYGESVGHYDGDTLVVDTIGLNDKTFLDNYRTPHTDKLHVIERWRLIEDGKKLEILMTIDDPDTFNQPRPRCADWNSGPLSLPHTGTPVDPLALGRRLVTVCIPPSNLPLGRQ